MWGNDGISFIKRQAPGVFKIRGKRELGNFCLILHVLRKKRKVGREEISQHKALTYHRSAKICSYLNLPSNGNTEQIKRPISYREQPGGCQKGGGLGDQVKKVNGLRSSD